MLHSLRCKRVCSVSFISRDVITRNGSQAMTGWTGHVAVLPAQATWHGHGNGASSVNGQRIWRRPSQTKADTAMYEDEDDDRFEAALRLAEDDPARAAEALRSIVADDAFDPDTRSEAAARLAEVDPARAAEALRSIVADDAFDPDTRSEAAARLAEVDEAQAAPFPGFAPRAPRGPRAPQAPRRW
jgi:hypothetical protein